MKKKNTGISFQVGLFLLFSSAVIAMNATNNPLNIGFSGTDSSVFRYVAKTILAGRMPYKDTFDHKGPIIYIIDAVGMMINKDIGIWILEFLTIFLIFFIVYQMARMLECGKLSSCLVVALTMNVLSSYFEGGNLVEEYACLFIALSLYIFLSFFKRGFSSVLELLLCGASFAVVCLLRINMIALWIVMCFGVLIDRLKNKKPADLIRFSLFFLAGAFIVVVPVLSWLMIGGAFDSFINDYILFNILYSTDPERASLSHKVLAFSEFLFNIFTMIAGCIIVYFGLYERKIQDWLIAFSIIISILLLTVSGQSYGHYGMILVPLIAYSFARSFSKIEKVLANIDSTQKIAGILSIILLLAGLITKELRRPAYYMLNPVATSESKLDLNSIAETIQQCTEPDELITVCGNCDILYLLSNRSSASIYSYQSPIASVNQRIKDEYFDDLKRLKAKMIILPKDYLFYEEVKAITNSNYLLVSSVGEWEVFLADHS